MSHYENVPFEVPEGWEWVSLSVIAHSCLGKMLDKAKNQGTLQPYLRNVNVRWGTFELKDLLQMPFVEEEDERFSVVQGDLVVCEGGEPGRCAIWENKESIKFQKALHRIRCFNGALNYYIKIVIEWYASSKNIEKYYTGSTIKHLTGESLNTLQIPLPPIQEQHRIVSIVDQWMSLIDLFDTESSKLKQSIEKAKSKILDLAIRGELVPQDATDEPALELLKRINPKAVTSCDNPHYEQNEQEIPVNWSWCKLESLCSFLSRGKSPKYSETDKSYPVFAQKFNLKEGGISLEQARFLDPTTLNKWTDEYKLKTGDVLVNSTGTGTVGRTRLFNESCLVHYPFVVPDSHVSVIRTNDNICSEYIFILLSSNVIQQYMEDNLAGSTNQKELYIGIIGNIDVPLPPYEEQVRISRKVKALYSQLDDIALMLG